MSKSICFVTTGDIKSLATAKRALGLANPLTDLGWRVSILMEDCAENRHRAALECAATVDVRYFRRGSIMAERKAKDEMIESIRPNFLYVCAFVPRNIVGLSGGFFKLVEHSELQSAIPDVKGIRKVLTYIYEYYSVIYACGLVNASRYIDNVYHRRAKRLRLGDKPMLYCPYAFTESLMRSLKSEELPPAFGEYKSKKLFLFLGSITQNYGVFTILEAVRRLVSCGEGGFKVLMLGRGRHYKEAVNWVATNKLQDYVELPGFVPEEEIPCYFSVASAFLSPMNDTVQDWARCPSKLYMYLPYGKPIVTSRIGEPLEVLGDSGLYYEPGDAFGMAEQMRRVIINGNLPPSVSPESHTWECRAKEFNDWLMKNFAE